MIRNTKIFILGMSCSGKSTLAKKLSLKYDIPHFEADDIYWKKKYSVKRTKEECYFELKRILEENKKWIIEGVFIDITKPALEKADEIIFLDIPSYILFHRFFRREISKVLKGKSTLKSFTELFMFLYKYKMKDGRYNQFIELLNSSNKSYTTLKTKKEIERYLEKLNK